MPGLFDLLTGMAGQPNPAMQIAARLGQAPGQPGSSAGPMPGAPPAPGAAPGGPPGAPAAPGGPQAPPQPQAYQSAPDLMQMYAQLAQHQAAGDQFNRGLGLLAASAFPGRRPDLIMDAMSGGQGPDAGSLFSNMMAMQNWQMQQQRYQAVLASIPGMAQKMGIDPSVLMTMAQADPEGFGKSIGQIEMAQAGLTGNLTDKEFRGAIKNYQAAHPGDPLPPELQTEAAFAQQQAENITTRNATAKDLVADKANFQPALQNYDKTISLVDQLQTPAMQEGMKEFLGTTGSMRPVATMSANGKAAWALYKQVMATQFAAGTQDFKGAGRITQQELNQDAPSQSTMGQLNQAPEDFMAGMSKYRDQLATHRANLFGKAGQLDDPALGDQDYGLVSPIYKPGGDLFVAGQKGRTPAAASSSNGAALKPMPADTKAAAQALIAKDPSQREPLINHLRQQGIDPSGL